MTTLADLTPGLRHSATLRVSEELAVPASGRLLGATAEMPPVFATYQNAGVRVFNIADPFSPREVAHFVPPAPERLVDPRPNRPRVIQSNDVYVAPDGLMYLTDVNDGLTILQYKG